MSVARGGFFLEKEFLGKEHNRNTELLSEVEESEIHQPIVESLNQQEIVETQQRVVAVPNETQSLLDPREHG